MPLLFQSSVQISNKARSWSELPPKFNHSFWHNIGPLHQILSQSLHNYLSNDAKKWTDRQSNATENI